MVRERPPQRQSSSARIVSHNGFQQVQWRVLWFLRHKVRLNVEGFLEPVHRRKNDLNLAIYESDYGTIADKGYVCANIHFGPLPNGGNHKQLKDVALDLSANADPDDPELILNWPKITNELNIPPEQNNRAGRQHFLDRLPTMRNVTTHGVKAASGKWGRCRKHGRWA